MRMLMQLRVHVHLYTCGRRVTEESYWASIFLLAVLIRQQYSGHCILSALVDET